MLNKIFKNKAEGEYEESEVCQLKMQTFDDFASYLSSPWRVFWPNFLAGIFRGLGFIVGMTFVFAILVWLLAKMSIFPVIGEYFAQAEQELSYFAERSDYNEEFGRLELVLMDIDSNLQKIVEDNKLVEK